MLKGMKHFVPVMALTLGAAWAAPAVAEDNIRIGITLRMIVENGLKYGQMTKEELEAVNATGGINGKKVEVILLDDECKPDKGVANVNRFIHQSKEWGLLCCISTLRAS